MREVDVAEEILEKVSQIASEKDNDRVKKVKILIGDLNYPKEVKKWLKKTEKEAFIGTKFEIERVKPKVSCGCGFSGEIGSTVQFPGRDNVLEFTCPNCGSENLEVTGGLEKEVLKMEMEEKK